MKRKISCLFSIALIPIITSCMSMQFDRSCDMVQVQQVKERPLEFIGFKASYDTLGSDYESWQNFRKGGTLSKLGSVLERNGMAYDQSFAYFGIYSLQELAQYKSHKRYVTFVEVEKHNFNVSYNDTLQMTCLGLGAGFLGGGLPLLSLSSTKNLGVGFSIAGAACLIPALIPAKTTIKFSGIYNIYVYDTVKQEVIYRDTVNIGPYEDKYSGNYFFNTDTDRQKVWDFYSNLVYNEILKKYEILCNKLSLAG